MKTHWNSNGICSLKYAVMAALLMLICFGCEKEFERSPLHAEDKILASEEHWVNPEGTILIALEGSLYLVFPAGTVTEPTLFTIASIAIDDNSMEENNTMKYGISITSSSQNPGFRNSVDIRLNYALEEFQRSAQVIENNLTIYKIINIGTSSETEVSIGQCCVDCSGKTVQGCISECGLYVVGELYVVCEV